MKYRHELKFLLSSAEMALIKNRLEPIMMRDPHLKDNSYTVRSLYFDDLFDTAFSQVEDGIAERKKYRLRLYNGDASRIQLERKSKRYNMTQKSAERISAEDCQAYMDGQLLPGQGDVGRDLFCDMLLRGMRPKCIVEYDRDVFIEPVGNVRITFDTNVRGCMFPERFMTLRREDCCWAMEADQHILEVKYDEFLPDHIALVLNLSRLQQQSVSKYVAVRLAAQD